MIISTSLNVIGMTCQSCVKAIKNEFKSDLTSSDKLLSVEPDLATDSVNLVFDDNLISVKEIAERIEGCGFEVPFLLQMDNSEQQNTLNNNTNNSNNNNNLMDNVQDLLVDIDAAISSRSNTPLPDSTPSPIDSSSNIISNNAKKSNYNPTSPITSSSSQRNTKSVIINVRGMTCASCVATIEKNLNSTHGIESCRVALLAETAEVQFDPSIIQSPEKLVTLIDDLGFEAQLAAAPSEDGSVDLKIFGMTCASCSGTIERETMKMDGMKSVSINLLGESGHFVFEKKLLGVRDIVEKIEDLGFNALLVEDNANSQLESLQRTREIKACRSAFWWSFILTLPVMFIHMVLPMSMTMTLILPGFSIGGTLQLLFTIPIQFGVGQRFYKAAYKALSHKSYTMDVLIVLGTTISFFFSVLAQVFTLIQGAKRSPEVFYETSASLITFVLLGRYLENLAKAKTSSALSTLMSLTPAYALLLQVDEKSKIQTEKKIPTELIQPGDLIKVVPGERIPADGTIEFGKTTVDESLVTGESRPISKTVGGSVIAGSINNDGMFHFRANRVGNDTTLSQILKLVNDAQTSKAPIQDIADKVASYFVPTIVALGCITFVFWFMILMCTSWEPRGISMEGSRLYFAVKLGISVIVVACPCALGLATPTAIMVGTGVGAQRGILIKGSGPLMIAPKLTKVVFDKTGTLTVGKMTVASHNQVRNSVGETIVSDDFFLSLVGCAEQGSEHPVGKSIVGYCLKKINANGFPHALDSFDNIPGQGIRAIVKNPNSFKSYEVLVGNLKLLATHKCMVPESARIAQQEQETEGLTVVLVAVDGMFAGSIALLDSVKAGAPDTVRLLQSLGLEVCMITGDQELTAKVIARSCGITEVHAGVSPNGKKILVEKMQRAGHCVAMIGDGVNDSASLAQADMGVAVYGGTDIAMNAADVVLMRNEISLLVTTIDLCRKIYRRIWINFMWATVYNIMMVPLAMGFGLPFGVYVPPMLAGLSMSLSSVSVVVSSLLLRSYKPPIPSRPIMIESVSAENNTKVILRADTELYDEEQGLNPFGAASNVSRSVWGAVTGGQGQEYQPLGDFDEH